MASPEMPLFEKAIGADETRHGYARPSYRDRKTEAGWGAGKLGRLREHLVTRAVIKLLIHSSKIAYRWIGKLGCAAVRTKRIVTHATKRLRYVLGLLAVLAIPLAIGLTSAQDDRSYGGQPTLDVATVPHTPRETITQPEVVVPPPSFPRVLATEDVPADGMSARKIETPPKPRSRYIHKTAQPQFVNYRGDDGRLHHIDPRGIVRVTGKISAHAYRVEITRAGDGKVFWGVMQPDEIAIYRKLHRTR